MTLRQASEYETSGVDGSAIDRTTVDQEYVCKLTVHFYSSHYVRDMQ